MSYILDALKKSEQERSRGEIPDIKSLHKDAYRGSQKNKVIWPYIAIVVVLLNAALVYALLFYEKIPTAMPEDTRAVSEEKTHSEPDPVVAQASQGETKHNTILEAPKPDKPIQRAAEPSVVFSTEPLEISPRELSAVSKTDSKTGQVSYSDGKKRDKAVPAADLASHVQEKIPAISFEGHVFSTVPKQRSVMINGQKKREGQNISSDLMLQSITPDGAVFLFQGQLFKLNALQDWNVQ